MVGCGLWRLRAFCGVACVLRGVCVVWVFLVCVYVLFLAIWVCCRSVGCVFQLCLSLGCVVCRLGVVSIALVSHKHHNTATVLTYVYIYGRVRFDLVVKMQFSFNVSPLVTILMVVMVIVTRGRLQGDGGGSRDQVLVCLDCLLYKFK